MCNIPLQKTTPREYHVKSQEGLRALCESIANSPNPDVHRGLMEFLHLLVPGLNSPVGVFALEIYSARGAAVALSKAVAASDTEAVQHQAAALESILENLDLAQNRITSIINGIDQVRTEQA